MAGVQSPGEEEGVQLPQKIGNDQRLRSAGPVPVRINAFAMDLRQAPEKVFKHELRFQAEYIRAGQNGGTGSIKRCDLARGPRNDESKETRRELHWALFQSLLTKEAAFFVGDKRDYIYDCAQLLYATRKLLSDGENREFTIAVENLEGLTERSRSYIRRVHQIRASLLFTEEVKVRNVQTMEPGGDRSVCHFLELLSTQRMHEKNEHFIFGNRMYEKSSVVPLQGDPRICKEGMQKNVRFVGDSPQASSAIIQLDGKKSAFFPGMPLLDFIVEFLRTSAQRIEDEVARQYQYANKQVKGLTLQTTHFPETQMTIVSGGFSDRPAHDLTFTLHGSEVNVVQYYQRKYNQQLRFPRLPCIQRRRGPNVDYFPIELLTIMEGQRVALDKQTPKLTEQMIRQCQVLPVKLPEAIETQRDKGMLRNENPFFRSHNVRIGAEMIQAEAQLLYPPALVYNPPSDRVECDQRGGLDWKMSGRGVPPNRRYTSPCPFPKVWAVVIVQNCVRREECRRFCEQLIRCGQQRGIDMDLPPRVDDFEETNIEYVREKFEFYNKHRCQFVMFFAPGKQQSRPGDAHHVFKLQEVENGVLTQHVSPQIMQKGIGDRGAYMVLDNIMMKMNLKMGGVNYDIATSQAFRQANRQIQHDIVADQWLGGKRMFFGLKFSHAPPQNLFERQAGKAPAIPTIVGMAYTVNKNMLQLNGTYWMQHPRVTTVKQTDPMVQAIKEALIRFNDISGHMPEHLFVYRGGTSEGEYKKVHFWEGGAFNQAFNELLKEHKMAKRPLLTIIVCQRASNYRMVPRVVNSQGKAPEQNCQPGTVLDKTVMHSSLTEFLLIGHRTIQGTAQPVRCTVVLDTAEPRIPLGELEQMTYSLCFQHGICTSPTAIPGVLYSAHDLAVRGRNNLTTQTTWDGTNAQQFDLPPLDQPEDVRAQAQLDEQHEAYFAKMSQELRPSIPNKFWA